MPIAAHRASFTFEIPGVEHDLQVLAFEAREAISRPFSVRLELVSEQPRFTLEALLHRQAFLAFNADGNGLHGEITEVAQGESGKRFTHFFIRLVPCLKRLEHRRNQRIFQNRSVPRIIAELLGEHQILSDQFTFKLREPCKPREYCTQYQESDLHFIRRLCEEEGLHFHFQHSRERHLLVFADDPIQLPVLKKPVIYRPGSGLVADEPVISRFSLRLAARPGKVSQRNYHFKTPRVDLLSSAAGEGRQELEDYGYPGAFTDRSDGDRLATKALERHHSDARLASGESDHCALVSGHLFELDHPNPDWQQQWLVTALIHEGRQPQVLEEYASQAGAPGGFSQGYRNRFEAIPGQVAFRPPLRHFKPRVLGSQHAVVTGPAGEEAHCDEFGRVKVQFFWDRDGQHDDSSSCWLRAATGWAHDQYGSTMIPRVGMEVVVGYFEGDPDQPYVQACLPNAATRSPLSLPAQKTQTLLRTQSSPGGGGYNELRIEDRKGMESIAIRAQRDWSEHVLNDQSIQVDNQRKVQVTGLSSHELHGEEHHLTHGQRKTQVLADDSLTVTGNQHISAANHLVNAAQQVHLAAGMQVVIDASLSTTIKAGGNWLSITPAGIFSSVPILLGGAPVVGMAAVPGLPVSLEKKTALTPPESAADRSSASLPERLLEDVPIVELCQKPEGKPPTECPLMDCPCVRKLHKGATQ
jgi:type VI secretion system secreted protein VgrG